MYINAAYLNNSLVDFMDKSKPLIIGSCGNYRIHKVPRIPTYRPKGRLDYQILYIASGQVRFFFKEDEETIVTSGHMVLYRPKEMQKYVYYTNDQTDLYWVHFTGNQVKSLLNEYNFPKEHHIINCGTLPEYARIFQTMIQELQLCKPHYQELLTVLFKQLLITISRKLLAEPTMTSYVQSEIEYATRYFLTHYNEDLNIEEIVASHNMSTSWFIRNFKQYTGMTPLSYILKLRITNAQNFLESTSYNVTEISSFVGYDNPLYFSRLFKNQTGLSPSDYRKQKKAANPNVR